MNKYNRVYPYNGIILPIKRNKVPIPTAWMSLKNIMLSERGQLQENYTVYDPMILNVQNREI